MNIDMLELGPILMHVVPFMLVLFRLLGLAVVAPVLSSLGIPMQARILLTVMLAAGLYPLVPSTWAGNATLDTWSLLPLVASEVFVGAAIGLIAAAPLLLLQTSGFLIGHQMALNLVASYSPDDESSDALGQMLLLMATAGYLAAGGLETLFVSLGGTFATLPAGGAGFTDAPLDVLVALLASGTELALRVSLPVIGMLMVVLMVMAFVGKTMPQLNIMSVGFPLKILCGLAVLLWAVGTIAEVAADEVETALHVLAHWLRELGS
ncbi:MAG: flagellar biosynthetic protein FliR [Phycisphaeraceae bacterium]|nr:flagellar biosynthetic protein FliR [Phycisphaeraceae bacterium]MCW5754082.1 flagellar biosynthetic protein FliR [Phycisphaeraceae bacterium]